MPKKARQVQKTVERKIFFYRTRLLNNTTGEVSDVNINDAMARLQALPFNEHGRYLIGNEGDNYCVWHSNYHNYHCIDFGLIRRSGLPQTELQGRLQDLRIGENEGLAEITNIVFFPNNIFGAVFNFYGPRPTRLANYFNRKIRPAGEIIVEPLIRQDALQQLERLRDINLFDIKIKTSMLTAIHEADASLSAVFRSIKGYCEPKTIHIVLSAGRKREDKLTDLKGKIGRILRIRNLHEETSKLLVGGISVENEHVKLDLLNDKLVSHKAVLKQGNRSRALVKESAYQAVSDAYQELRTQLQRAAGARI